MKDYHQQHGCHDCAFLFVKEECDEGPSFYCVHGSPRPAVCGSEEMGESFWFKRSDKEARRLMDTWDAWRRKRRVHPYGICSSWVLKKQDSL